MPPVPAPDARRPRATAARSRRPPSPLPAPAAARGRAGPPAAPTSPSRRRFRLRMEARPLLEPLAVLEEDLLRDLGHRASRLLEVELARLADLVDPVLRHGRAERA